MLISMPIYTGEDRLPLDCFTAGYRGLYLLVTWRGLVLLAPRKTKKANIEVGKRDMAVDYDEMIMDLVRVHGKEMSETEEEGIPKASELSQSCEVRVWYQPERSRRDESRTGV